MLRGLYESASALKALQQAETLIANNIANMSTPGYRSQTPVFSSYLPVTLSEAPGGGTVGTYALGVDSAAVDPSAVAGPIRVTGRPLDIAPRNTTWIAVSTPSGTAYTQNGRLEINANGQLTTAAGYLVQSVTGGPLAVAPTQPVRVLPDGVVVQNGAPVGQIRLVTVNSDEQMAESLPDAAKPTPQARLTPGGQVLPGALREADVNLAGQAAQLINVAAWYQANEEAARIGVQAFATLRHNGLVP